MSRFVTAFIFALVTSVLGKPFKKTQKLRERPGCVGIIDSLASVATAQGCSTINIKGFTVPAKRTLSIQAVPGAKINLQGSIVFEADTSFQTHGPLFTISGTNIEFNGNDFTINGQGDKYWDGWGTTNSKRLKPHPMIKLAMSGTFQHVKVLNSPAQVFSMGNKGAIIVSHVNIDNSAGNVPNSISGRKPAARNNDGVDVSTNDVTIQDCTINNQDDAIAISNGNNIKILRNRCINGHGISIGSVSTGQTVSKVYIAGNEIVDSDQALRIKTLSSATNGLVNDVTYEDNRATGCRKYGVLIDQSYPQTLGRPQSGVKIQDVKFIGENTISLAHKAKAMVEVNCATGRCSGRWDWAGLKISGAPKGTHTYSGVDNFAN